METDSKRELRMRNFKLTSLICILCGIYTGAQAVGFTNQAMTIAAAQGLETGALFGGMMYTVGLLTPVLLVVAGVFGLLKKPTAVIVFSAIAFAIAAYACVTNISALVTANNTANAVAEAIPLVASALMPLILGIYAFMIKKDKIF